MSKLAAIKRQIAALEAEAERITRQEISGAIAKVKELMGSFGLTIEHLQSAVSSKKHSVAKKMKSGRAGKGVAKYADPKTGKTWSGFGRAPAWISGARNRDAFLVAKSGVESPEVTLKASVAKKKIAIKKASTKKAAKPAAKKAVVLAKRVARPAPSKRKPSAKKAAPNAVSKKTAKKRGAPISGTGASTTAEGGAPSAS